MQQLSFLQDLQVMLKLSSIHCFGGNKRLLPSHGREGLTIKMTKNIPMMHGIFIVVVSPSFIRDFMGLTVVLTVIVSQVATQVTQMFVQISHVALELYALLLMDDLFACAEKVSDMNSHFHPKKSNTKLKYDPVGQAFSRPDNCEKDCYDVPKDCQGIT